MRTLKVLVAITLVLLACDLPSITVSFGQLTPTPTATPTPTVNVQATTAAQATTSAQAAATAQAQATATAQAQATANARAIAAGTTTAQAQATTTAQAQATATAQAQATATAQAKATATAQAQATATAQAQATATAQTLINAINTLAQSGTRILLEREGKITGRGGYVKTFVADINSVRNFVVEVQLSNPADRTIHPWDYGIGFRTGARNVQYRLILDSDSNWTLNLPITNLADRVETKTIAKGTMKKFDVSAQGSNLIRLVVNDKLAFLFVNGEYVAAMDVSERNTDGGIFIATNFVLGHDFPDLVVTFQNFTVLALP